MAPSSEPAQTIDALPLWLFFREWHRQDQQSGHQSVDLQAYYLLTEALLNGVSVGSRDALFALCRGLLLKPHHNPSDFKARFDALFKTKTSNNEAAPVQQNRGENKTVPSNPDSKPSVTDPSSVSNAEESAEKLESIDPVPATGVPKSEIVTTKVAVRFGALEKRNDADINNNDWETEANTRPFRIEGSYEPIESRAMRQHIRQLRQQTYRNASLDVDLAATIDRVTKQGFFKGVVRKRNFRYEVPLTLLVDRRGSMVPFHHLSDQLADAVLEQPGSSVRYFQNCFEKFLFQTPFLTEPEPFMVWKSTLPRNPLIVILSDAGAARGFYKPDRITQMRTMIRLLRPLRVVWLNPMPRERWWATSATEIATDIPMYTLNETEISTAIKNLNGLMFALS